ncbi:MAG: aspartate kinase [Chitinophagaceae bacterium]|nr:aspartate kinase [Chitinophagaceae bacterium]
MTQVFKFGGASIETPERAAKVAQIIQSYRNAPLVVVISAKGKTTNALELIARAYFDGEKETYQELYQNLEKDHLEYAQALLRDKSNPAYQQLTQFFTEMDWILSEVPGRNFDYYYDQIVCLGELLSTTILAAYLKQEGIPTQWLDIRDIFKTDDTYRDATIFWDETKQLVQESIAPICMPGTVVVTQGFIGSTDENHSVTLGREGSDYTAAVLTNMLDAEALTIWKDVPSLLNADPKIFPNTIPIEEISFHEVIEMAYYGAQVIHPKTIKPLHNKNIPLYVRCFLDPEKKGTKIYQPDHAIQYPPLMVLKTKQILLQVTTRDFSFITEDNLSRIYELFHDCKIKINLIQNAAISFVACIDDNEEKLQKLLKVLQAEYEVKRNEDLFLFTVRHYTQHVLREELKNRTVLLTQKTRHTIQMVVR